LSKYDEYVTEETTAGREPLEFGDWRKQRMAEGRAAAREEPETAVAVEEAPEPVAEPEPASPSHMVFWSENRNRVEIVQAGGRTVIDNQMAIRPHIVVEFIEHHWVADMDSDDDRYKAEWLLKSKAMKTGEIVLVPMPQRAPQPPIQTGPRTTLTPRLRVESVQRPESTRDVAAAMSARLE